MELAQYLKIIKNYWLLILIITIIGGLAAYLGSQYRPTRYEGETTFLISPIAQDLRVNPPFYEYDGFYSIQSSQLFANTVSGWLTSPDIVEGIYKQADLTLKVRNVKQLQTQIQTTIKTSQSLNNLVDATFNVKKRENILKLSDATYVILKQRTQQFNQSTGNKVAYKIEKMGSPVIVKVKANLPLNLAVGLFAGLIFGVVFAFIAQYLKIAKK